MKYPVIYVYKKTSDKGRELRYSLRSLSNLKDWNGQVYIVGHKEDWMQNIIHVEAEKSHLRHEDANLKRHAITKLKVDDFIMFNDDFYVTKSTKSKCLHQGEITDDHTGDWFDTKRRTRQYLQERGIKNPLDYDIHVPMLMNRESLVEVMALTEGRDVKNMLMVRTLYGNLFNVGGEKYEDQKSRTNKLPKATFISTNMYTPELDKLFPNPSNFERA